MDFSADWDLLAVVRSCSASTTASSAATVTNIEIDTVTKLNPAQQKQTYSPVLNQIQQEKQQQQQQQLCFSPTTATNSPSSVLFGFSSPGSFLTGGCGSGQQELQDIYNNINNNNTNNNMNSFSPSRFQHLATSSSSSFVKPSHVIFGTSSPRLTNTISTGVTSQSQRAKKRKNLLKKVCHVPAEGLSSDMWAWRKYGQKPIKGSPYPRGYYRCSSSKGCLARKQVERNRSDPKMFIVTYTSEHNHPMPTHRNSLAGSTRQRSVTVTPTGTPPDHPTCSSPSAASLSPLTDPLESKIKEDVDVDVDDDMGVLSDLMLNDDFYVGFEQIDGGSDDSDCFSEQFSPSSEFPWLSNGSSTATAAGGG